MVCTNLSFWIPLFHIFLPRNRSFLFQVPITIFATLLIIFALHIPTKKGDTLQGSNKTAAKPQTLSSKLRRIDVLGALTLVTAVFTFLLGLDTGSNVSWTAPGCYIPLIISALSTLLFCITEATPSLAREPLAPTRITTNPSLVGSYLVNFFVIAVGFGALFQFPMYAQAVKGKTPTQVGVYLLPPIFSGVSGSLISGVIMQKTGKYKMMTVSTLGLLIAACIVMNIIVDYQWGLIGFMLGEVLFYYLFMFNRIYF